MAVSENTKFGLKALAVILIAGIIAYYVPDKYVLLKKPEAAV